MQFFIFPFHNSSLTHFVWDALFHCYHHRNEVFIVINKLSRVGRKRGQGNNSFSWHDSIRRLLYWLSPHHSQQQDNDWVFYTATAPLYIISGEWFWRSTMTNVHKVHKLIAPLYLPVGAVNWQGVSLSPNIINSIWAVIAINRNLL